MSDPVQQPSWFSRYFKWIALGCGGLLILSVGFCVFIAFGVMSLMKSSDAFNLSLKQVQASAEVQSALGTPVKDGWYVMGSVNTTPESGSADIGYPISGPKGTATVHVQATKTMGTWKIDRLAVAVDGTSSPIDLVPQSKAPAPTDAEKE